MHLLGQNLLGVAILLLLGLLVLVKRLATGSVLEAAPRENLWIWLTNLFNLFFLLVVNPLAAVLLLAGRMGSLDPAHLVVDRLQLVLVLEIAGLFFYGFGFVLMAWALLRLGQNYQLGGSAPRGTDEMVMAGPYRFVRHPMYAAVLSNALGLALLVQSLAFFLVFIIYLVLILYIIPVEEQGLQRAYPDRYRLYQHSVKKLVPYLY